MQIMRILLPCLLLAVGTASAVLAAEGNADSDKSARPTLAEEFPAWPSAVSRKEELARLTSNWKWVRYNGMQIAVGVVELGDGEAYGHLGGYVYNQHFKEWRRFLRAETRNAGNFTVTVDEKQGMLRIVSNVNNDLKGKAIISWNLAALSDDRAYVH
jgi:hypothetical protein